MPSHLSPEHRWWNAALWVLIGALFFAAQFAARHLTRLPDGIRLTAAFSTLYLMLGLLAFTSQDPYRFNQAASDFALLYLVFSGAAALRTLSPVAARAVFAALVITVSATAIVPAVHAYVFGFAIAADGYRALLQSSAREAVEFSAQYLSGAVMGAAAAGLIVAGAVALTARPPRLPARAFAWCALYALAAISVLGSNSSLVAARMLGFTEAIEYASEIAEYRALRDARRARGLQVQVTQAGPLSGEPQTYVFVVGESLTRKHMSLYGYWRDTTPALARLAGEMAVFTDAVAPHSHTDPSLERILTLADQANRMRFTDAANFSLIELMRAAGFTTWWISNQNSFGPWDNKTAALAAGADHVQYTSERSGRSVNGPLDEALLEPFAAALRDPSPRKVIFLHFLGNHWQYAKRYPPHERAFRLPPTSAEIGALRAVHGRLDLVNEYDNAVHYHDRIVTRVIESLRSARQASALILFSDHGESVYGMKGHYWREFTPDHVEVPLLLWFSAEYTRLAGDVAQRARAQAQLPFALENLPHLVADLAGLRGAVFEPQRSPLSSSYRAPQARPLFEGSLVYEEANEAALNARRALQRIRQAQPKLGASAWAHRVDTLAKMSEVAQLFRGAEIDVVFDAGSRRLTVNHPPEPPSGLTLDAQLGHAHRLNPALGLWLDLKNLAEENAALVLEELDRLDARYAIRGRAIVETTHTGPAAALLRRAGYRSSYYLPTMLVTQSGGGQAGSSCSGAEEVKRTVEARRFAAISYDWRGRHWVERCLGAFVKQHALHRYTWDLEPVLSDARAHALLDDERLRGYAAMTAVLLPYRTAFDDTR